MMNLGDFLVLNANRYPERTAVVYRDQRITYRGLNEEVNRLAHHLIDLGVQKGDRVGLMFYNSSQFIKIFFATVKIGAMAVPLNFRMIPREVKWILDKARCKVFAYSEACSKQVEPVKKDLSTVDHLIYSGQDVPSGEVHFEGFVRDGNVQEPKVNVDFEDPSHILFTGGTTGVPKGAVHTHRSGFFEQMNTMLRTRVSDADEVVLSQIPMFHGAGLLLMRNTIASGGKLVIVESFDAQEMLRLIDEERATRLVLLPPATYIRLIDAPNIKDFDVTSVNQIISSVAVFPKQVMLRLFDTFPNAYLLYGYGAAEIANSGTIDRITRSMFEQDLERIRSVGREQPLVEIRLVDEKGQEVPVGETGEAIVRGPMIMKEYFDQPELTAQTIKDGWVYTGDLLRKDKEGFLYFMGRNKDMIKSGGENVFAQEVEGVIMTHPSVENCAVIGVPDPMLGEAVMAVIKLREGLKATEEQIAEHCKKYLSSYKKPRRVAFVDSFPMTDVGKVQKFKLREQYST